MKRITLLALIFLLISHAPHAYGQDTARAKHATRDEALKDGDEQETAQTKPRKKQANMHALVGLEVGGSYNYLITGGSFNGAVLGWRAGVYVYIPVAGTFCIQPGLFYATGGGAQTTYTPTSRTGVLTFEGSTSNTYIQSVELPVNFGFRFGRRHGAHTFLGIGPYVAYDISATSNDGTYSVQTFDYGVGLLEATEFRGGFTVSVRAHYGFANLSTESTVNSFGFGVQLGFVFGDKGKRKVRPQRDDEYIERRM